MTTLDTHREPVHDAKCVQSKLYSSNEQPAWMITEPRPGRVTTSPVNRDGGQCERPADWNTTSREG